MMADIKNRIHFVVSLMFFGAFLFACGGGGGDDGGGSSKPDPVDHKNTKQVMGSITSGRIASTIVSQLAHQISPIRSDQNPQQAEIMAGAISDQGACTGSGTNSISMNWQGPAAQDITSCEQVSNLNATLILEKCIQQDKPQTEQSMTLTVFKDGSLCRPSNISADVDDLHVVDNGNDDLDIQSDELHIDITEITYSNDNKFMTHANVALSGDARGTKGNRQYAAQFNNFVQIIDTQDNHHFTATFSGRIQSECMGQWAEIRTITPIQFKDQDCPTQGAIEITIGGESTTVRYQSNGSATIGDTTFDSCQQLEGVCNR
ncbi:MAG: hypothetical protein PVI89_05420 [Desulfobacteraceae bacterium]|jgi:hypothetical protein